MTTTTTMTSARTTTMTTTTPTTTTTITSTLTTTMTSTSTTERQHERASSIQLGGVLLHILAMAVGDWSGPRQGAGAEAQTGARPSRAVSRAEQPAWPERRRVGSAVQFQWSKSL